mgnify:CR=1 FL=1
MSEATNQMTEVLENILQVPDTPTETEAVETTEEIPQEAIEAVEQTEEVEVEEADDDSDLLEFEETEETEETDEAEEQPDNLIPVKIDGNEEMWTLDQLKQSAAGQGYINKRMQEIASVEKNFKSEIEQLTLQRQQMLDFFNQAKDQGLQEPVPPSADLFDSDPIAYMQEKLKYDESKTQHDAKVTQMNELQTQQNAANEARLQEYTMNQAQLLTEKLPEIADPDKGEAIKKGIAETGEFYGFTAEELGSVRDHRYILAMHDAMRYRQLVQKKAKATSGKKESLGTVKAGAKKKATAYTAKQKQKAQSDMQKTGSVEDVAKFLLS